MKKYIGSAIASLIVLFLQVVLIGCEEKENITSQSNEQEQLDKNIIKSPSAYEKAMETRHLAEGTVFTIEEVIREEKILKIRVKGGCSEDSFQIIWDGRIMESYPMQVHLVLTHSPTKNCQDTEDFSLVFDLEEIVGQQANLSDYVFYVANSCMLQEKIVHPDGVVTDK